jgi:hypothetical protein
MRLIIVFGVLIITIIFAIFTNIKARVMHNKEKDTCKPIYREPENEQNETCAEFPYYCSEQSKTNVKYKEKQHHKPSKYSPNIKKLCGSYAVPSYNN